MSRATPEMKDLTRRLIAIEGRESRSSSADAQVQVIEKMRPHLVTLMGNAGFRALLSRALALASKDFPPMREVIIQADGSMDGLTQIEAELSPKEVLENRVNVLAQLFGLLVAFIGANLTLSLIRESWSNVTLEDLNFNKGRKN